MRIFLTGATGFIGSAVIKELTKAGHEVLGLARSDEGAKALQAAGVAVHRGDIENLQSLRSGAAQSDGVIHAGFNHDFSKYMENCEADRKAIEALGDELKGSQRPLLVTSGIGLNAPGRAGTENDPAIPSNAGSPRSISEETADAVAKTGVRASVVRLPQVHDPLKQGLITFMIAVAREKDVSAYVGDGQNRWPAVHVLDCAVLYKLAIEKAESGAKYHAVAEEGVTLRDMAESIGRGLKIPVVSQTPEQAVEHFGWLGGFIGRDLTASSKLTQERLGWHPTHCGMIEDLDKDSWV